MHPFKIFVFALIILLTSMGFLYKKNLFNAELPPVVECNEAAEIDSVQLETTSITSADSSVSYFEGCKPDSCFAHLVQQLKKSEDTIVRIIFFGDSQLEGDYFTMPVRKALQNSYGGYGIGYMPAEMYFNTTQKLAIITADFTKHVVHSGMDDDSEFGFYGRFFTSTNANATLRIKNRDSDHRYHNLKIIYSGKANLVTENGNQILQEIGLDAEKVGEALIEFDKTPEDLKLKFNENRDLKLYGLLLDPLNGVVVDHVPFRGNLNLMMNHFGENSVQEMGTLLQPALVVLQYGLNVIPDIRPDYESYRIAFERDIQLLKKFVPEASILIIGAPDMAHKVDGEMHSYANIGKIIDAQRTAAFNNGVAFWNMRKAMGGKGSVLEWVNEDLVRTDYAHLNAKGSEKMATIFSEDLLQSIQPKLKLNE